MNLRDSEEAFTMNIHMRDVESAFAALNLQGSRRYYECLHHFPTGINTFLKSHFKGVASFGGKMLFTHTVLDLIPDPDPMDGNGQYLIGNVTSGGPGNITANYATPHPGWLHPCGAQVCGSFMAMGLQESASEPGSKVSEILICDVRNIVTNGPVIPLAVIPRTTDGINGVAMTKQADAKGGGYVVAGVNGNSLTIYTSPDPSSTSSTSSNTFDFRTEFQDAGFPDSGAGLGLITQADGQIYLVAMNAEDDGSDSTVALYRVDLTAKACVLLSRRAVPVPGLSDTVATVDIFLAAITIADPLLGAALAAWLLLHPNTSFRWGRGLAVTSPESFELYATDRNVIPLSTLPLVESHKDFSMVVWGVQDFPKGIAGPVGAITDGRPYAFMVGTDGHLWQNYWDNNQWNWYDSKTPPSLSGSVPVTVSTGVGVCVSGGNIYAFVVGSDGGLWQNYWDGARWQWNGVGTAPGGVTVASGVGVCTSGDRPYAFVVGSDGHLWQNYWDGQQWKWNDLGTPGNSAANQVKAGVGVCTSGDRPYAFVIGSDGHLWQNYWDGNQWNWNDLWASQSSSSISIKAGVGVCTSGDRPYAFVIGSDGHLRQNYWDGNQWVWNDLLVPPGPAVSLVKAGIGVCTSDDRPYAFVVGSEGKLWQNYWDGEVWCWNDLGNPPGPGSATVAAAVGTCSVDERPYAFLVSSSGHLCQNYWDGHKWQWIDMGA